MGAVPTAGARRSNTTSRNRCPSSPRSRPTRARSRCSRPTWCGYCTRLKGQLAREGVPFTEIDLEANPEHVDFVERVNGGNRTVPTVVFPDGSAATNPSLAEVRRAWPAEAALPGPTTDSTVWPSQCSMIRLAIEMPLGVRIAAAAQQVAVLLACHPPRLRHLDGVDRQLRLARRRGEADHDRRGERPRLVAEVADAVDGDARPPRRPRWPQPPRTTPPARRIRRAPRTGPRASAPRGPAADGRRRRRRT